MDQLDTGEHKQCFSVELVEVVDQTTARLLGGVWPDSLDKLKEIRLGCEGSGRGTVAAITLEIKPLGIRFIPIGSLRGLGQVRVHNDWKAVLRRHVEDGKEFTYFGDE